MLMIDYIVLAILVILIAAAGYYVYRAKKSGKKCIGCPDGCSCCAKKGKTPCGCGGHKNL